MSPLSQQDAAQPIIIGSSGWFSGMHGARITGKSLQQELMARFISGFKLSFGYTRCNHENGPAIHEMGIVATSSALVPTRYNHENGPTIHEMSVSIRIYDLYGYELKNKHNLGLFISGHKKQTSGRDQSSSLTSHTLSLPSSYMLMSLS